MSSHFTVHFNKKNLFIYLGGNVLTTGHGASPENNKKLRLSPYRILFKVVSTRVFPLLSSDPLREEFNLFLRSTTFFIHGPFPKC